jgi:hypothetical protein
MSSGSWPNFDGWLQTAWGSGMEFFSVGPTSFVNGATNLVFGQNPPYFLDDFFAAHPKFFGPATTVSNCTISANSNVVGVNSLDGLDAGQFVRAHGLLPKGAVITSVSGVLVEQVVVHGEIPAGSLPGTDFTLSAAPPSGALLMLLWNGLLQTPGVDYTLVGNEIATISEIQAGDSLFAMWQTQAQLQPMQSAVPSGALPGQVFTLPEAPPNGTLLAFTWNGEYQTPGVDYVLAGNAIVMIGQTAPQDGDNLFATWLSDTTLLPTHGESPSGVVPGQVFMLSQTPPNSALQSLTANGQFLVPGVDYFIAGTVVALAAPLASGSLFATWLTSPSGFAITLNNAALKSTSNGALRVYEQPPIPLSIVLTYLRLAFASLVFERWQEQWTVAMGWFIAHYLTLWAKSDALEVFTLATATHGETPQGAVPGTLFTLSTTPPGGALQSLTANGMFLTPGVDYDLSGAVITMTVPFQSGSLFATWPTATEALTSANPTSAQIAAQGLAGGIQTSKSVGDVSVGYQALASLENWGQWQLTTYGQQLATMAAVIGSGPMVIY